ncbi:hypothetical protein NDU88_009184 [Pleurodeles waltl]|uniref:Uncharacterized protein n=1 Tax=Pleurodeles waltl TaxID=8319 RepID=A0AAV7PU84_PLEWA|nr:hypothetical protein NDU88_009184 [Pleurodeles waltl]
MLAVPQRPSPASGRHRHSRCQLGPQFTSTLFSYPMTQSQNNVLPTVPEEARTVLFQAIADGRDAAKFIIRCGLDMTNSLGRLVASTVRLRRHTWLKTSGFSGDVQQTLMDMPFDATCLFGDKAGSALERFKDS